MEIFGLQQLKNIRGNMRRIAITPKTTVLLLMFIFIQKKNYEKQQSLQGVKSTRKKRNIKAQTC